MRLLRKWGFPVLKISGGLPDPIEHLGDPDETPEPTSAPEGRAGMSPPRFTPAEEVSREDLERLRDGLEALDPNGQPVTEVAGRGEPAPVVERLDVEPEPRPWDNFEAPPRQPAPRPGTRLVKAPHCDGRHGEAIDQVARRRCEWCDALTDVITVVRQLERESAEKDERIAELERRLYALDGVSR